MTINEIFSLPIGEHKATLFNEKVKICVIDKDVITIDETEFRFENKHFHIDKRSKGKTLKVWIRIAGVKLQSTIETKDLTLNQ